LLFNAYGIGGVYPRPGMDPTQMLAAPQASMMAAVANGVLTHNLPWNMIGVGAIVAAVCIVIDEILKRVGTRLPVLAVGLGIYLPMSISSPVVIGGFLAFFAHKNLMKMKAKKLVTAEKITNREHNVLLLACGMVAGAALMGVILAIPFAIAQNADVLRLVMGFSETANILSIVVTILLIVWFYRTVCHKKY
jgi:putative OPT family oligopeptide transporter